MVSTRHYAFRAFLFALALVWGQAVHAVTLIRDADIENALKKIAQPLISAAGLSPSRIKIIVLKDPQMNAFVVDGAHVFINSGLILRLQKASELQAVIAHELAHISGGHLVTRSINANQMQGTAALGILLGLVSAAAGNGEAAAGVALGVSGSARGVFLGHTRSEEASADAASVRIMSRAGVDPRASLDVLELFRGQEVLSNRRKDAYARTHPLTSDRIRALQAASAGAPKHPNDPTTDYWFKRAKAKLSAFLVAPSTTLRQFKKDDRTDIAQMARAIAYHRKPDPKNALSHINLALAARGNDPYLYDLKGQILLESRQFPAAAKAFGTANSLLPNNSQILAGLGRAQLALGTKAGNKSALVTLKKSYARDGRDARMLRDLAVAYARSGNKAMASLATAERYAMLGRTEDAILHASRATKALPEGSPAWRRAKDIIHAAKIAQKKKE